MTYVDPGWIHPDPDGRLFESASMVLAALSEAFPIPVQDGTLRVRSALAMGADGEFPAPEAFGGKTLGFVSKTAAAARRAACAKAQSLHRAFLQGALAAPTSNSPKGVHRDRAFAWAASGGICFPLRLFDKEAAFDAAAGGLLPPDAAGGPDRLLLAGLLAAYCQDLPDNGIRLLSPGSEDRRSAHEKLDHQARMADSAPGLSVLLGRRPPRDAAVLLHRRAGMVGVLEDSQDGRRTIAGAFPLRR